MRKARIKPKRGKKTVPRATLIRKLKKKADVEWSLAVRKRDGGCCQVEGCGRSPSFAHHIFSRRHLATRWDMGNGFTICWGHHKKGHVDHEWLRDEIIKKIGEPEFGRLKELANQTVYDLSDMELEDIIKNLRGINTTTMIERREIF